MDMKSGVSYGRWQKWSRIYVLPRLKDLAPNALEVYYARKYWDLMSKTTMCQGKSMIKTVM